MPMISYAQNLEDVMLARVFDQAAGTFVDVGANRPIRDNLTYHFYRRGWRGINVEPQPAWHAELDRLRPDDVNVPAVVGAVEGTADFHIFEPPMHGLSTLDRAIAEEHAGNGGIYRTEKVEVLRLDTILDRHLGGREIDFLSVDVEGAEAQVIASIDLSRRRPRLILFEAMAPMKQVDVSAAPARLLREADYVPVYCDGLNRFFLAAEHADLARHFRFPPNVFDGYRRFREVRAEARFKRARRRAADLKRELAALKASAA